MLSMFLVKPVIFPKTTARLLDQSIADESLRSSTQAAEPALWHPTPVAPPFIDIFNEDRWSIGGLLEVLEMGIQSGIRGQ